MTLNDQYRGICFLDRDGTINVNTGYPHRCSELDLLPNAAKGIRVLNENSIAVVVVSNQSGVGRGFFDRSALNRFQDCMASELFRHEAQIDIWRYCPHHPDDNCYCRKPKTGMIDDILKDCELPTFFVGDSLSDMLCAQNANALSIALRSTEAAEFAEAVIVNDLFDAAQFITKQCRPNQR